MKLVKLNLMSKNNVQNGFYLYRPIVMIDGNFFFCESIKTNSVINTVDNSQLKITRQIPVEFLAANGL